MGVPEYPDWTVEKRLLVDGYPLLLLHKGEQKIVVSEGYYKHIIEFLLNAATPHQPWGEERIGVKLEGIDYLLHQGFVSGKGWVISGVFYGHLIQLEPPVPPPNLRFSMPTSFTAKTLRTKLLSQACYGFQINRLGDDEFCLIQENNLWQVVYAERGAVQEVLFESESEAAACDFLYNYVTRFRYNYLAGWFWDLTEAQTLSAQLTQLGLKNDIERIPWGKDRPRYRVMFYGKDVFKARRQYGKLPLERVPTLPERIHGAIRRLTEFTPDHDFKLNPPVDRVEQQVWSALEFSCGYLIPKVYERFLLEVGDGGRWGSVLDFLSFQEVFEANSKALYKQPTPEFVQKAISANGTIQIPHQDIGAGFPGLLRITQFSYNQLAWYMAHTGEFVYIEDHGHELSVQAEGLTLEQFYQQLLDDLLEFGRLETYEHTLELMQFGMGLEDLEKSLGNIASLEWKHGIIATILKTTPDNLGQKLIAWQEQHGSA